MSEENTLSTLNIDNQSKQLAQHIIDEPDIEKVKELTQLFNLNQAKKNVLRVMKLNGLLDTVSDKIIDRFDRFPDNFSNDDLIKYLQVTQTAIEKANKNLSLVDDTPIIQVNHNNQLNVNISDTLDRESRERVLAFVKAAIQQTSAEETDFVEIEEEVDNNE
jgi:hypothetical protein